MPNSVRFKCSVLLSIDIFSVSFKFYMSVMSALHYYEIFYTCGKYVIQMKIYWDYNCLGITGMFLVWVSPLYLEYNCLGIAGMFLVWFSPLYVESIFIIYLPIYMFGDICY